MLEPPEQVRRLPTGPGVYRFRDGTGRVLYIGRASSLRSRVRSYFAGPGDRPHLRGMAARIARVEALACASVHEACWLELNLHRRSLPRWNRATGGQEVPAFVAVEPGPARPGLAYRHDPYVRGPVFGPYLGGWKIRTALAGLHRVLPLAYTGTGLSGSERQFAELRGVGPDDRDRLLSRVVAILGRDHEAVQIVRAELSAVRDEASAEQRYVQAGAITDELRCLDWLVAPQRVSRLDRLDATVIGKADGVLVTLEVRSGRVDGWRQRVISARSRHDDSHDASGELDELAELAELAGFARINAELAARLLTS